MIPHATRHRPRDTRRLAAAWLLAAIMAVPVAGCSRLETEYGKSTGRSGKTSLNGFGGLRALYQIDGWQTRSITRVGPRVEKLDTIVWTPTVNASLSGDVSQWFDQWLAADGKTLVWVVYDGGSEAAYWREASRFASPPQRLEYRRRAARAELQQLREWLPQSAPASNGWFVLSKRDSLETIAEPSGPWAPASSGGAADRDDTALPPVRFDVQPYDESQPAVATTAAMPWQQLNVDERSDVTTELQPLLLTASGVPVVTRVRSDAWLGSQVLVVSAGSLLTNYGLTQPLGRVLATQLVASSGSPGEVGFITSDWSGISMSSQVDGKPSKSGMELLTVWPLSLVTIHAALLGLVVCLILMPIFGRPRNPPHRSQSDFADHLDAVAALLARTGGDQYARQRISDYVRRVRGETVGPWVLPETTHPAAARLPYDAAPAAAAAVPVAAATASDLPAQITAAASTAAATSHPHPAADTDNVADADFSSVTPPSPGDQR